MIKSIQSHSIGTIFNPKHYKHACDLRNKIWTKTWTKNRSKKNNRNRRRRGKSKSIGGEKIVDGVQERGNRPPQQTQGAWRWPRREWRRCQPGWGSRLWRGRGMASFHLLPTPICTFLASKLLHGPGSREPGYLKAHSRCITRNRELVKYQASRGLLSTLGSWWSTWTRSK